MAKYEGSQLQQWLEADTSRGPAPQGGPRGLGQTQQQADFGNTAFGQWAKEEGLTPTARGWYTGRNLDGTANGWETGWLAESFKQLEERQVAAMEAGDSQVFFDWFGDNEHATGLVTWDDPEGRTRLGDVYNDGQRVGNLYEDYDRKTANVLMADYLLDGKTKNKIFNDPDRDRWLDEEIGKRVDADTEMYTSAEAKAAFAANVGERQEKLLEGQGDSVLTGIATVATGLLAGGAAGVVTGAPTGPGAIATGIGGAVLGGFGAWQNRDQLTELTARAMEISSLANQQYGEMEQFTTGLREFGGVGLKLIAPFSNITQGLADRKLGETGDGEAEFYALDADGNRKVPGWVQVADVAATLADSVLQFSSGVGVGAYMTGTGAHVAGSVGTMARTGAGWDDRTASFNDYEGAGEWAAAIGNVGIDVVQMGMAGALVRAGSASRAAFGAGTPGRVTQAATRVRDTLMPWRAAAEGTRRETVNGMRFTLDEVTGKALSARPSLTLLAPSEAVKWVPTAWRARTRSALSSGGVGADDFYRAARELAGGGSTFSRAVLTGWAEGTEEAVQAVLEPISFDARATWGEISQAYFYGMAAGAGMAVGSMSKTATADQVLRARADALAEMRNGTPYSDAEWAELDIVSRERLAVPTPEEQESVQQALRAMAEMSAYDTNKVSVVGTYAVRDLYESKFARDLANANPSADNVLQLGGMSTDRVYAPDGTIDADVFPAHAAVTSAWQMMRNITDLHIGLNTQLDGLQAALADARAQLATAADPTELERRAAELEAQVRTLTATTQVAEVIRARLLETYDEYRSLDPADVGGIEAAIDQMNEQVREAFERRLVDETGALFDPEMQEAARRSVEMLYTRHPAMDAGSFVPLMPQVSKALSRTSSHGMLLTHQATLKALNGDHDGDTMVTQNFTTVPQDTLDLVRAGANYLSTVAREDGTEVVEVIVDPPDGEARTLAEFAKATKGSRAERQVAQDALIRLLTDLHDRYTGRVPQVALERILGDFETEVLAGNVDARLNLANALFTAARGELIELGRTNGQPEVPWLMQRISLEWERFEQNRTALDPGLELEDHEVFAPVAGEKAYQRQLAVEEAGTDGLTMTVLLRGDSDFRKEQGLHYSVFRAAVEALEGTLLPAGVQELIENYAALGSNLSRSELARVRGRGAIQKRVVHWLSDIADKAKVELGPNAPQALMLLANTRVRDIRIVEPGVYEFADGDISLLQLLLKRSVEIEEMTEHATIAQDEELQRKISRLKRLTRRDPVEKNRSTTAQLALAEVFGAHPLYELLGDSAKYLGPQLTMNQLIASLGNRTEESRQEQLYRWKRKAPYRLHEHQDNPPYALAQAADGTLSSYKVLVDTVAAVAQTAPRERRQRNKAIYERFVKGIGSLQAAMADYRRLQGLTGAADVEVLHQLLRASPRLVADVAALIPDAARVGAFKIVDGHVFAAKWVDQMLTQPAEQAAVTYFVYSKIAEWNQLGGNVDLERLEEKGEHDHPRAYSQIKSRMLQTFYHLAAQPDGIELNRLLRTMKEAKSLPDLMQTLNADPAWRGDRAQLLAFFDDVAEYEADPADVWTANLPGRLQHEAITAFAERTTDLSVALAATRQELETERNLLGAIRAWQERKVDRDGGRKFHALLDLAIRNQVMVPDAVGPRAYDRFAAKISTGILRGHDKGKPDPAVAPLGDPLVTVDEFGVKQSVLQAVDGVTAYDVEDILTNPTLLADGPVRVGQEDGSFVRVDLSTVEGALAALEHPGTNALAKRVLFPVARDVNNAGAVQHYQDVTGLGLKSMLEAQGRTELFPMPGTRPTLEQAMRFIRQVEAGARKAAIGRSAEEQAQAYFPIMSMVTEFIVAYTHRNGFKSFTDSDRAELFIDVADALMQLSALGSDALRRDVVAVLRETLRARLTKDTSKLRKMLASGAEQAIEDIAVLDAHANIYSRRAAEITAQLADPNLAPELQDVLKRQLDWLSAQMQQMTDRLAEHGQDDRVLAALNMFTLTGNPDADLDRKGAILRLLGNSNRIDRVQGNYMLIDKVNWILTQDPTAVLTDDITDDEWRELGAYAATVYLAELHGRAGSSVTLSPLVLGTNDRFFDYTWSYLADGLLNKQVLEVGAQLARQAHWPGVGTAADVAGRLAGGLFNPKKLGGWTELVVPKMAEAQRVLSAAAVGLAIPVGGDLPKEMAAYVGAGRRTPNPPMPEATALTTVRRPVGDWTAEDLLKLDHHFAGALAVHAADGRTFDLLPVVGQAWLGDQSVEQSPYRVITLQRIDAAVAELRKAEQLTGPVEVEVSYFDVDTKPSGAEWANNVYYEGVGRESATGTTPSLISEQIFGIGGVSKTAQQRPLDAGKKGARSYTATPVTPLATTEALEQGATVAEVLRDKTLHLMGKTYDVGTPLDGDANSFYALLKRRHVVVGENHAGEKEVWWAEQAIHWQSTTGKTFADPDAPLRNARLVPLSDAQAQTLLGEPGTKGLPGVVTPYVLNLDDMSTAPDLSTERLRALGLTRLGEETSLADSSLAGLSHLGRLPWSSDFETEKLSRYEAAIVRFRRHQSEARTARVESRLPVTQINDANVRRLDALLGTEAMASLFARLGVPFLELRDTAELQLTEQLAKRLAALKQVNPASVVWQHVHGASHNPAAGVLSEVVTEQDFERQPAMWPTFEDIVVLDLDSFEKRTGGDLVTAYKLAREALAAYTRTGATVVLASSSGATTLRSDLAAHLAEGREGYAPLAESRHFFAPINPDFLPNQPRRSLESTLTAVNQFTGSSLILTHLSNRWGDGASENVSYWDLRPEQPVWRAEALTLVPTVIGHLYGLPQPGVGQLDQVAQVRDKLLPMLTTAEGRAHLARLGGDPQGVPVHRVNPNGTTEPGIRSLPDAIARLTSLLEAGKSPLEVGEEIMLGDLVPLLGADDTILLTRVGFQLPDAVALREQLLTPLGESAPVDGRDGAGFAIARPKLQQQWTVRPPAEILEVTPDTTGGTAIRVRYSLSRFGKGVAEGDGWKTVYSPLPNDVALPEQPLADNGLRVNALTSRQARESKQAVFGQVRNFQWAFALAGIDFRPDLVNFFLGERVRDADELATDWDTVRTFLDRVAALDTGLEASEIAELLDTDALFAVLGAQLGQVATETLGSAARLPDHRLPEPSANAQERLVQVILGSLLAPRIKVDHIIGTSGLFGLSDLQGGAQVTLMPELFTDALNSTAYPELRELLFDRIDARLPRNPDGTRAYYLAPDWQFHMEVTNPQTGRKTMEPGILQVSLEYAADENPVTYAQAAVRSARQGASQHVAFTTAETIGGRTATDRLPTDIVRLFDSEKIERFEDVDDGAFWRMMRAIPARAADKSYQPWRKRLPLQQAWVRKAYAEMTHYLKPVDTEGWTEDEQAARAAVHASILDELNLPADMAVEVDYLVRQFFGMPGRRPDDPEDAGRVSPEVYQQAGELILNNVRKHLSPVFGGVVPLVHETFWSAVKEANDGAARPWAPKLSPKKRAKLATSWDEWVTAGFGQFRESEALFDSMFRLAVDGFMHSYQSASEDLYSLPVSTDTMTNLKLMDKNANEFVASLDPNQEALLAEPIIFETMNATLDSLVGHASTVNELHARSADASELAKRIQKHVQWHYSRDVPKQQKMSARHYVEEGSWYLQSERDTHNLFHSLVNLSIGMRLLNPALWTSAIIEMAVRNTLEETTNILEGRASGRIGTAVSKLAPAAISPRYSTEDLRKINKLAESMGRDDRFLAVIYDEMTYRSLVEVGRGRVGRGLERFAAFSARATSDPSFGMLAKNTAKRYIEAALAYLEQTDNVVPLDAFIAQMNRNPLWLRDQFGEQGVTPHRVGMNRVAHARSVKASVPSKVIMGGIDALTTHPQWTMNFLGHAAKIPFVFTRFNANALITMTGMGGFDQALAMFLDGRESPFRGRLKALASGRQPEAGEIVRLDMSDVIEGVDLARPFIRGAVTQTGLMALGMLTGSLGLSGEDEETKRRRRLAQVTGTPYYYDPRRVENDFRHADNLFLDWLPGPLENLFNASPDGEGGMRSYAAPHWIVRQFLSPVVGIERFLNTGDFRHVKWGFADAFSVIPTSVTRLWRDADMTADELARMAKEQEKLGTDENLANSHHFLISAVGMYEKALFENSFVNTIRNAGDDVDRNPWAIPLEKNGEIQENKLGFPQPTDALSTYRDGEEIKQGYETRGPVDALLHGWAENNATFAVMASLFTGQFGGDSSYLRDNMVPKINTIELPPVERAKAEAMLWAAIKGLEARGEGLETLTVDEVFKTLRQDAFDSGARFDMNELLERAKQIAPTYGQQGALSVLDKDGREVLTKDGARAVLRGLAAGTVELGHPSLEGIYIDQEMRREIQAEWFEELIQEGVDLGLDEVTAKSRANRLWYGHDMENPDAVGLREILWSTQIPRDGKIQYYQLNTTNTLGPDGLPYSTGISRGNWLTAMGVPLPHRSVITEQGGLGVDIRGNTVDNIYGINTGLRAQLRIEDSWEWGYQDDFGIKDALSKKYQPSSPTTKGSGWVDFGGSGWRNFGSGGGSGWRNFGSGGGSAYFTRMYALPQVYSPYGNDISFINTSNPIIRRANIRRERVWSERGRLNQWQ